MAEIFNHIPLGTRMESLSKTIGRRLNIPPDYKEASYYCHNSLPIRGSQLNRQVISTVMVSQCKIQFTTCSEINILVRFKCESYSKTLDILDGMFEVIFAREGFMFV